MGLLHFLWRRLKSKAVLTILRSKAKVVLFLVHLLIDHELMSKAVLTLACLSIDHKLEQALASKKVIAKQMFDRLSAYGIVSRSIGSLRSLKLRSNAKKVLILPMGLLLGFCDRFLAYRLKSKAVLTLVRLPIDHEAELAIASAKLIAELMCDCLAARGIAS
ncbi:hypothetical protein M0802_014208 [Mischocyttarus mexicanus]|nr:hypothetical protein M0802_014208 [Mischocyttarus mexicanus]